LLSLSRGGIVVAVMSCVLYGTLQSRLRKPYPKRSGKSFGIVVILLLFTLGAGLGYELLSVELGSLVGLGAGAPDLKLESWSRIVEVVRQYPLMGVGSGAFGDVFAGVNDLRPGVEFSHVENLPLQLVVDYGVPVALMILGASCFFLLPSLKTSVRDEDSIGAFAGLYAVFVQNFVDFSLGILGVAIPATIVLAVLVGRRANETRDAIRFRSVPNRLAWPLAMTGVLLLVWAGWNQEQFGDDAVDETMQARVQAASVSTDSEFSVSPDPWAMEVAMKRPMDSHFFLQQGIYYSMVGNLEEGIRWINASIERNPRTYGARLILAQTLLASEKEDESAQIYQALLEDYWEQRGKIFADIATRSQNADFFEKCLPRHETSVRDAVYWLKTQRRKGWAYALLNERVQLQPNDYALRYQLGLLLMESQTLVEEASIQASQLMARHPGQVGGYLLQGHLYEREEKWPESLAMFIEACRMDPQDGDAALGKARLLAMMGKYDEMREVIGALRPQLVGNTVKLARMHAILSTASEGEGRLGEAVLSMEMATALRNNHAPSYVRLGNLYLQISDRTKGRSAFEQALLLEPDNAAATRALEEMDSLETR